MTNDVAKKTKLVVAMEDAWAMCSALLGGTKTMREAGALYMPKWPSETDKGYSTRLAVATLYPAYGHTVSVLAGKPFSREVGVADGVPKQLSDWLKNVDREGRNIDMLAAQAMEVLLGKGMVQIVVDYPALPAGLSVEAEKAAGARPYMAVVQPDRLLGWKDKTGTLLQVRYTETVNEEDGEFGEKEVKQIRVLSTNSWQVWRRPEGSDAGQSEWKLHESGAFTLGEVPMVTAYGKRLGFMVSKPPMMELAYQNVKHWQSQSDQDNIMHIARVPILTVAGVDDGFKMVLGAGAAVKLPVGAAMVYVEHSGASIGAGKQSLDDLKEEMRQTGAEMMVVRPAARTATEVSSEDSSTMSELQRITLGLQDALNNAVVLMAKWAKLPYTGEALTLFNEFGALVLGDASAGLVLQASTAGVVSKETAFNELKRRGTLDPDADWADEQEKLAQEGPPDPPQGKIDSVTGLPYTEPSKPPPKPTVQ